MRIRRRADFIAVIDSGPLSKVGEQDAVRRIGFCANAAYAFAELIASVLDRDNAVPQGRRTGPLGSGRLADFSFQSFDQGVTGRGSATPSTSMASTSSLKKQR